jgi:hypothetical protein
VLRAFKQQGVKQEYPRWVHKPVETKEPVAHPVTEKKIVHSKAEEEALGSGWYDPTDEAHQKKAAAAAKKDA